MYYVKITSSRGSMIDYKTFRTKKNAKKWLSDNGYVVDVISIGHPVKSLPDIYWNSNSHRQAMIFEDKRE